MFVPTLFGPELTILSILAYITSTASLEWSSIIVIFSRWQLFIRAHMGPLLDHRVPYGTKTGPPLTNFPNLQLRMSKWAIELMQIRVWYTRFSEITSRHIHLRASQKRRLNLCHTFETQSCFSSLIKRKFLPRTVPCFFIKHHYNNYPF